MGAALADSLSGGWKASTGGCNIRQLDFIAEVILRRDLGDDG
jgi:hypothetical protein